MTSAKAGQRGQCPKCHGVTVNITPLKEHSSSVAVFACQACGYTSRANGKAHITDPQELKDAFAGLIHADTTLVELLAGENVPKVTKNLLLARIIEYGLQQWNEGLKQGLLIDVIRDKYNGKVRSEQGNTAPGSEKRGGSFNAEDAKNDGGASVEGSPG